MYLADYHVHSTCSPDGHQTMAQAAEAAVRQGLRELCITDHVDTIHWGTLAPRDDFDWEESRRQFHEAQALWGDRITLRRGAELGEAQLSFDRADRLLAGEELDFVIGSVHLSGKKFANMDLYYIEKGSEAYYDSVIDSYLDDVLALARWGRFQVLGHLTLPLRYINEHHGEHMTFCRWGSSRVMSTSSGAGAGSGWGFSGSFRNQGNSRWALPSSSYTTYSWVSR